jgi:DNA-directed RNA polymerase subunit RPC12/RpoP
MTKPKAYTIIRDASNAVLLVLENYPEEAKPPMNELEGKEISFMIFKDRSLQCVDCGFSFPFSESAQEALAKKDTPAARDRQRLLADGRGRCPKCLAKRIFRGSEIDLKILEE